MQASLETSVCKFGSDPAICLVEEAFCTKYLQTDGQTDDGRHAIAPKIQKQCHAKQSMCDTFHNHIAMIANLAS